MGKLQFLVLIYKQASHRTSLPLIQIIVLGTPAEISVRESINKQKMIFTERFNSAEKIFIW